VLGYNNLEASEGVKYLPKVWNLCFKPLAEDNYFVEPWKNQAFRDCAEFRLDISVSPTMEILFFVTDPELLEFLKRESEHLLLYGAYNQITVCQMRAKGFVTREVDHPEKDRIREDLRVRISSRISGSISHLSEKAAEERYAILDKGSFFCFRPEEYAYSIYDRG
jgi:hypothetical protein